MEILIVLLVFLLPVVSVLLDDKKKKNVPKVKSKRIVWPEDKPQRQDEDKPAPMTQAGATGAGAESIRPVTPLSPETGARATADDAAGTERAAMAGRMPEESRSAHPDTEAQQPAEGKRQFSEKQKLIIYSEILKPKFDG